MHSDSEINPTGKIPDLILNYSVQSANLCDNRIIDVQAQTTLLEKYPHSFELKNVL